MLIAASSPPAGGAPIDQVAIATGFATITTAVLLYLLQGHRSGRSSLLGSVAAFSARVGRIPSWAALPSAVATGSLLVALFGVTWDVSIHIDKGRDPGPLANPAHYFILVGLYGIFAAGLLAMSLPSDDEPRSATAINLPILGAIPVGGALMLLCSSFALLGFPLDDVWHRLFGQDVTLWGPTHIMMIAGAVLTIIAIQVLETEGQRAAGLERRGSGEPRPWIVRMSPILACGGLLIGLSVFQGEFDWGVAQFRQVWHPLLLAGSSSLCLVAARLRAGRGGAIGALVFYLVAVLIVNALVGDVIGRSKPAMPLYVVEALCVEAVGWRRGAAARPIRLGVISGLLIGTVGFAAEYAWTNIAMPLPWHTALIAEGLPTAIVAGVAGGILGALFAGGLRGELPAPRPARLLAIGAAAALLVVSANALFHSEQSRVRATIALRHTDPGHAYVTAKFDPPSAAKGAEWVDGLAWQGDGLVINHLEHVAGGTWRTTKALPLTGDWKTMLRVHKGRSLLSAGVYLRADPAIPFKGFRAANGSTQTMVYDQHFLQLERKRNTPAYLWTPAVAIVLLMLGVFITLLALGVGRLGRPPRPGETAEPPRFSRTGKLIPAGAR
ncbi:MAG: hypothetical protein E6G41_06170 [Actinobacteria bacterium]|nr:MAG: hypothetical protein E6G41_06170 [Actinomycetota bacterium]